MLGEIFGLNAGLTRLELMLFLFFELRASFASFLPLVVENAGLAGVEVGPSMGLGLPDMLAPGVLKGCSFGVFRAERRGVSKSSSQIIVSTLESAGRSNEASGSVRSSNIGGTS